MLVQDIFHTMKIVDFLGEHQAKHEIVLNLTKTAIQSPHSCLKPMQIFVKKSPQ